MNISVVLNYNEIPVEAYKMGTFNLLMNGIMVTIFYVNNDKTEIKYHQLLPTSLTTVIFFHLCPKINFKKRRMNTEI